MSIVSDDYYSITSPRRQVFTSREIGIPGIRLFGHLLEYKVNKPLDLHIHKNCIEICFIAKGNQFYKTADMEYMLTGNTAFITLPNEIHGSGIDPFGKLELYWIQLDVNCKNDFLSLSYPFSNLLLDSLLNIKNRQLKFSDNLKPLLDNALTNIVLSNKSKKMLGLASLHLFINRLIEQDDIGNNSISLQIQKSINYITENIDHKISLISIAEYISLSLSHFKKRFKKETGETPNDYINYLKIQKAKLILKTNDVSITSLAYDLDFSSSAYFSVVFRRYTNMTPVEYLKNYKDRINKDEVNET